MIDLVIFLLALIITPLSYILNGWALSILWAWYIAPFGLPPLTIPRAIGIALVVGFLTNGLRTKQCKDNRSRDEKREDALGLCIAGILSPLITLFIGWIVYQFVG